MFPFLFLTNFFRSLTKICEGSLERVESRTSSHSCLTLRFSQVKILYLLQTSIQYDRPGMARDGRDWPWLAGNGLGMAVNGRGMAVNGRKWPGNWREWPGISSNGRERPGMAGEWPRNGREWLAMAEKCRELSGNGREWRPKMAENGQKWPGMAGNVCKWPGISRKWSENYRKWGMTGNCREFIAHQKI